MSGNQPDASPDNKFEVKNILPKIERTFLPVGKQLGKYRIIEEIDRGGMAVVYKAFQTDLEREVALKVLPANITIHRRFVDRFLSEAHSVAKLNHPNIVSIHEVSMQDNIYYLAMDYLRGKNLFYYLNFEKPKLVEVVEIVIKLTDALAYAHNMKIVHRDLKLNNVIMIDRLQPVLIDFGLAKAMENEESAITRTGEIIGSPAYMAPERLLGQEVDERSDVCSLGIMLYEMATFKNPYLDQRSVQQTAVNVIESNPIPPRKLVPWLPRDIEAIIMRAIHGEKEKRYQSMDEFRSDLLHYQRGETVTAKPPSIIKKTSHLYKRHSVIISASVIVLLFVLALGVMMYTRGKKEQSYWRLIYSNDFTSDTVGDSSFRWYSSGRGFKGEETQSGAEWRFLDNKLIAKTKPGTLSFFRLQQQFSRDIQITCHIKSTKKNFHDVGLFLYGNEPDSAYRFVIHHHGSSRCGIIRPGSELLYGQVNGLKMPTSSFYHLHIRKSGARITMRLNGKEIARIVDCYAPVGSEHSRIGFFSAGEGAMFDNLRVYRASIPALSGPELAADRFKERGEYNAALKEYNAIFVDHPGYEKTPEIFIKMAECYMRLQRYDAALQVLDKVTRNPKSGKDDFANALRMKQIVYAKQGMYEKEKTVFSRLVRKYSGSDAVDGAYDDFAARIHSYLYAEYPDSAARLLIDVLKYSNVTFRFDPVISDLVPRVLEAFNHAGRYKEVIKWAGSYLHYFQAKEREAIGIKSELAYAHLQLRNVDTAKNILNNCVVSEENTLSKWLAWMRLAKIYDYSADNRSAHTIYKKVFNECGYSAVLAWRARLKMGELSLRDEHINSAQVAQRIYREVARASHPFPGPRLIARYYIDSVDNHEFSRMYRALWFEHESGYYYHMGNKACLDTLKEDARRYYRAYQQKVLQKNTWEFLQMEQLLSARF